MSGSPHSRNLAQVPAGRVFLAFLRYGAVAWGGPAVQLEAIRAEFVERRAWVSDERFRRALSVYQALPGPEAHEMCCWLGANVAGRLGALAAGLGFMLPGFVLMMLAAAAYVQLGPERWAGATTLHSAFRGLQVGVLALIAIASVRLFRSIVRPLEPAGGALVACTAVLFQAMQIPFWITLLAGGVTFVLGRRSADAVCALLVVALAVAAIGRPDTPPAGARAHTDVRHADATQTQIFTAGLLGGLTSFGGAYTALPVVRDIATGPDGWMTEREFVDGVAIGGVLPAPMVIFGTFVGFVGGGWLGGVLATIGMFLPAFSFTLIGHRAIERVVEWTAAHAFLDGVACAACGLIIATAAQLLMQQYATLHADARSVPVAAALLVAASVTFWVVRRRFTIPATLAAAALAGALLAA